MVSVELVIILILSVGLIASIWKLLAGNSGSNDIELRRELREMNRLSTETLTTTLRDIGTEQQKHLANVSTNINELKEGNEKKLDQMRDTVDEKLQSTLEKRISESFKLVSDRLEACLLYTSPSPRDATLSRMPSSA